MAGVVAEVLAWQFGWARERLTIDEVTTMLALGVFMNQNLTAFPSFKTLCETAGCHPSVIARGTKRLEERGALHVDKGGGRGNLTVYRGLMPKTDAASRARDATVSAQPEAPAESASSVAAKPAIELQTVAKRVAETVAPTHARDCVEVVEQVKQVERGESRSPLPRREDEDGRVVGAQRAASLEERPPAEEAQIEERFSPGVRSWIGWARGCEYPGRVESSLVRHRNDPRWLTTLSNAEREAMESTAKGRLAEI